MGVCSVDGCVERGDEATVVVERGLAEDGRLDSSQVLLPLRSLSHDAPSQELACLLEATVAKLELLMAELSDPFGDPFLVFPDKHGRQLGHHGLEEHELLLILLFNALSQDVLQVGKLGP